MILMVSFTAVRTASVYARPGRGTGPLEGNTAIFAPAAEAGVDGFRVCVLCRPHRTTPPAFMTGPDIVCHGVGMVLDGFLDDATETEMSERLGVSSRHLRRLFKDHLGVTPNELARSSRAHFARGLLDDTDRTVTEIAFAAGFGSVRQMNRVFKEIFRSTPTELRARRRQWNRLVADGGLPLRLAFGGPFDWPTTLRYFKARTIPGVESVSGTRYRRTVTINGDPGVLEMEPLDDNHLLVIAHIPHWEELTHIAQQAREVFGLHERTERAREHLGGDPLLGPLVERLPGIRVPGSWNPFEIGIMAIVEQAMPVPEARRFAGRLARRWGRSVPGLRPLGLTHLFPEPARLAHADLGGVGLPRDTQKSIAAFSRAVSGEQVSLDRNQDMDDLTSALVDLPGVGESAANYVALRLGFHDAFPAEDAGVRNGLEVVGAAPENLKHASGSWIGWRALAATYLMMASIPDRIGPDVGTGSADREEQRSTRSLSLEEVNALAALEQVNHRR